MTQRAISTSVWSYFYDVVLTQAGLNDTKGQRKTTTSFCNQTTQNVVQIFEKISSSGRQTYKYCIYNADEREKRRKEEEEKKERKKERKKIQNTQEIKRTLFNQAKQDKTCTFSRKSSFSSYVQKQNKKQTNKNKTTTTTKPPPPPPTTEKQTINSTCLSWNGGGRRR